MAPAARRRQLIAAARRILIFEGYAALSLRAVAGACDVRLSTVQHYFGSRPDLVYALIDALIEECFVVYGRYREEPELTPEMRLRATLTLLIANNEDEETALLFPELWAFAEREPAAASGVERLYHHGRAMLAGMISDPQPGTPLAALDRSARLMMALADGLLISRGRGESRLTLADREQFVEAAMRVGYDAICSKHA